MLESDPGGDMKLRTTNIALSLPDPHILSMPHRSPNPATPPACNATSLLWWRRPTNPSPSSSSLTRSYRTALTRRTRRHAGTRQVPGGGARRPPTQAPDERIKLTRKLLDDGAPAIFEASFLADNTFVAGSTSSLHRTAGYHLTEVKVVVLARKRSTSPTPRCRSTSSAIRHSHHRSGRHAPEQGMPFPGPVEPFERTDVTAAVAAALGNGWEIDAQLAMLDGPLPMCRSAGRATSHTMPVHGPPLLAQRSRSHHAALQHRPKKGCDFLLTGVKTGSRPSAHSEAQRHAEAPDPRDESGPVVVEATLGQALTVRLQTGVSRLRDIMRAVPCGRHGAWEQAPAQFSYPKRTATAPTCTPSTWRRARRTGRPELARPWWKPQARREGRDVLALRERRASGTAGSGAGMRAELEALEGKLVDLLAGGSGGTCTTPTSSAASVSNTCSPAGPELTYDDLVIVDRARGQRRNRSAPVCGGEDRAGRAGPSASGSAQLLRAGYVAM